MRRHSLQVGANVRKLPKVIEHDDEFLEYGTKVEVRQRFDGKWSRGFLVERGNADGYVVRREHDDVLLPETFSLDDVRAERRKHKVWWRHHH